MAPTFEVSTLGSVEVSHEAQGQAEVHSGPVKSCIAEPKVEELAVPDSPISVQEPESSSQQEPESLAVQDPEPHAVQEPETSTVQEPKGAVNLEAVSNAVQEPEEPMILLPDLFLSWAAEVKPMSPYYKEVGPPSIKWLKDTCGYDEQEYKKWIGLDAPFFIGMLMEKAGPEEYRLGIDVANWLFAFDDLIDENTYENPEAIKAEIDEVLALMTFEPLVVDEEKLKVEHPLRWIALTIWQRFQKISSQDVQQRYYNATKDYCYQVFEQSNPHSLDHVTTIDQYLEHHSCSSGSYMVITSIEAALGIKIPNYVFEHQAMKDAQQLVAEILVLQNDVYSHQKEVARGDNHNFISIMRSLPPSPPWGPRISEQEATNHVGKAVADRYRRWYIIMYEMPQWEEKVDGEVQRYLKGCQELLIANLRWSFQTKRYFGEENVRVHQTRLIKPSKM